MNNENPYRSPLSHGERPAWIGRWLRRLSGVFGVLLATSIGGLLGMTTCGVAVVSKAASFEDCDPYFEMCASATFSACVAAMIVLAIGAALEYLLIDPPLREGP